MKKFILAFFFISSTFDLLFAESIQEIRSNISLSLVHTWYKDVKLTDNPAVDHDPTLDLELSYRLFKIFNSSLFLAMSPTNQIMGAGIGFRIDLPGFFFIAGQYWDLFRKGKNYPINTSFYMNTLYNEVMDVNNERIKAISSRFGLTCEVFIFNKSFSFVLDGSLYTLQGNSFASAAAGLNFPF
jgi:hypothetical protein